MTVVTVLELLVANTSVCVVRMLMESAVMLLGLTLVLRIQCSTVLDMDLAPTPPQETSTVLAHMVIMTIGIARTFDSITTSAGIMDLSVKMEGLVCPHPTILHVTVQEVSLYCST